MQIKNAVKRLALAGGLLSIVSACGQPTPIALYPPAVDVEAAAEPKPLPPVEIATDEDAALAYDLSLEAWGERVSAAGLRVCLWLNENGADYDCER